MMEPILLTTPPFEMELREKTSTSPPKKRSRSQKDLMISESIILKGVGPAPVPETIVSSSLQKILNSKIPVWPPLVQLENGELILLMITT